MTNFTVIPAKAGISTVIPAKAGISTVIPAKAGISDPDLRRDDIKRRDKNLRNLPTLDSNGQVTIFVLLLTPFLIMLFLTVVYISLMVNAKINLQNAADLAAMAGAAEQARVMTMIGIKNYELKKNTKELALFVNVIHNWESGRYYNSDRPPLFCAVDSLDGYVYPSDPETAFGKLHPCETILSAFTLKKKPPSAIQIPVLAIGLNFALFPIYEALQLTIFGEHGFNKETCDTYQEKNKEHLEADMNLFYPTATDLLSQINDIKKKYNTLIKPAYENTKGSKIKNISIPNTSPEAETKALLLLSLPDIQNPNFLAKITAKQNLSKANSNPSYKFYGFSPEISLEEIRQSYIFFWTRFRYEDPVCRILGPELTPAEDISVNPGKDVDDNGYVFITKMPIGVYQSPNKPIFYAVRLESEIKLPEPLNHIPNNILPKKIIAYAVAKPFGAKIGPTAEELANLNTQTNQIYVPNELITPNYIFPELNNHGYNSVGAKTEILNTYYKKNGIPNWAPNNTEDERLLQRNARHDRDRHGPIRKWARAPKSNEFGDYIFNLSFENPGRNTRGDVLLSRRGGLDYFDFYWAQQFIPTPDVNQQNMASFLMQTPYTRIPAGVEERRNGYSVKLISFDEIEKYLPTDNWPTDVTKKILH